MVEIAQNLFSTRRGSVLVGAAAAVIAGIVLVVYLHQYRNSVNSASAAAPVLVASQLIPKGTPGDLVGSNNQFQVGSVPKSQLAVGALTDLSFLQTPPPLSMAEDILVFQNGDRLKGKLEIAEENLGLDACGVFEIQFDVPGIIRCAI